MSKKCQIMCALVGLQCISEEASCLAISFCEGDKQNRCHEYIKQISASCSLVAKSCLIFCNPVDCPRQAPLSMGFSRERILEWVSSRDLPDPGNQPVSPVSPALAGGFLTAEPPGRPITSSTPGVSCPALGSMQGSSLLGAAFAG